VKIYVATVEVLRKKKRKDKMKLSLPPKLGQKLVWVPVISFCKTKFKETGGLHSGRRSRAPTSIYIYTHYALYIEVGWRRDRGVGRFGQGTGQGQLKLKKKCRYKVINCQACRNPNLLEAKNFHFLCFLCTTLSLSRWKRRVLACAAAMRHRD